MIENDKSPIMPAREEGLSIFMEQIAFQKLKRIVTENGISVGGYREEYLKRRFEIRLRATGANTYGKYVSYLKRNPQEFDSLRNDLTINFTMFFRDSDVYEYLEKTLLTKLFETSNPTRIWSAGCASGEEPYSLAILTRKILKDENHPVTIFASDIDKEALSTAKKGEYQLKQLGALNAAMIEEYFTKENSCFRVKDSVRSLIRFEQSDLMVPSMHQNIDLVLCRNVMIYFSKESQQKIHMHFYHALKDGGYFITGKSEILSGEPAEKFQPINQQTRSYRKPSKTNEPIKIGALKFVSKLTA